MYLASGSCVNFQGDAIVNAANECCQGGGGVDGAITAAGGPEMAKARAQLPVVEGTDEVRCRTGDAVVTVAGALPVMVCIHAVGPIFPGAHGPDELDTARMNGSMNESEYQVARAAGLAQADATLRSAYTAAMAHAKQEVGYCCSRTQNHHDIRTMHAVPPHA
mmetsp:Transcript_32401/g.85161  ORF Transcript_32401/g.85161 Transcript_32401/m.85161 type:complete len:163 (-) Transcript_32401:409-897(-)